MDVLDELIEKVPNLPPAPTVAVELLGLFNDPDRDIDRVVQLISHDPSLTAEVLKRCGSAAFGGRLPTDVFEAVNRLGFYEIYCVVVSVVGTRSMSMAKSTGAFDVGALWLHSVLTAVASSALADECAEESPVAFTTGLLHDIGKLIFASADTARYSILTRAGNSGRELADREAALFGKNHAALGARLLSRWKLPPQIIVAVLNHHGAPVAAGPFERLAACVNLGNLVAHWKVEGKPSEAELVGSNSAAAKSLGLVPSNWSSIFKRFDRGLTKADSLLKLTV